MFFLDAELFLDLIVYTLAYLEKIHFFGFEIMLIQALSQATECIGVVGGINWC